MNRRKKDTLAVSEVMGTIILLGISVSLFSVIYVSFFAIDVEPSTPTVDLIGTLQDNHLILEHQGGEDIDLDTRILVMYNETNPQSETINVSDYLSEGEWNIGEKLELNLSALPNYQQFEKVDVMVVDSDSNSAIMMGTLQEIPVSDVAIGRIDGKGDVKNVLIQLLVANYGPTTAKNATVTLNFVTEGAIFNVTSDTASQGSFTYNENYQMGTWNIPSMNVVDYQDPTWKYWYMLDITGKLDGFIPGPPLNQLVLLLDGSDGVTNAEWNMILQGIANGIINDISHNDNVEITVIQYGDVPFTTNDAVVEIPPTVISDSTEATIIANNVLSITKLGGTICPLDDAFRLAANTLDQFSENTYSKFNNQLINVVMQEDPGFSWLTPIGGQTPLEPYHPSGPPGPQVPPPQPGQPTIQEVMLAREYMRGLLEMDDSGLDQINFMVTDEPSSMVLAMLDQFVLPEGIADTSWEPDKAGWVRVIDNSGQIGECIDFQIVDKYTKMKVEASIFCEYEDPDPTNNGDITGFTVDGK